MSKKSEKKILQDYVNVLKNEVIKRRVKIDDLLKLIDPTGTDLKSKDRLILYSALCGYSTTKIRTIFYQKTNSKMTQKSFREYVSKNINSLIKDYADIPDGEYISLEKYPQIIEKNGIC